MIMNVYWFLTTCFLGVCFIQAGAIIDLLLAEIMRDHVDAQCEEQGFSDGGVRCWHLQARQQVPRNIWQLLLWRRR